MADRYLVSARRPFLTQTVHKLGYEARTLAGNATLTRRTSQWLRLDPGGGARDVTLPAVEDGLWFEITNTADAAENLVIKTAAGATVVTISQNEKAKVVCGASWAHLGIVTIALT